MGEKGKSFQCVKRGILLVSASLCKELVTFFFPLKGSFTRRGRKDQRNDRQVRWKDSLANTSYFFNNLERTESIVWQLRLKDWKWRYLWVGRKGGLQSYMTSSTNDPPWTAEQTLVDIQGKVWNKKDDDSGSVVSMCLLWSNIGVLFLNVSFERNEIWECIVKSNVVWIWWKLISVLLFLLHSTTYLIINRLAYFI